MVRPTKETLLSQPVPTANNATDRMDKTTRLAWEIVDAEQEEHKNKTARLRKARLEREDSAADTAEAEAAPKKTRKPKAK
ncbi:hypothetical protein ATO6_08490 [Oceanicola sp. 22II-s10i]|uniref:hypothetical protein n=1 Tax=Oceanicola sp. 22II-s10i TaxID=1317116 RepID=UPI000B5249F8|nr:hypothetical protein [Oceanicola sp. 22II-s10i]OWU85081.1 hypothetical protein ATO6_08490 [Oceanicola sp. 22II-s10i]